MTHTSKLLLLVALTSSGTFTANAGFFNGLVCGSRKSSEVRSEGSCMPKCVSVKSDSSCMPSAPCVYNTSDLAYLSPNAFNQITIPAVDATKISSAQLIQSAAFLAQANSAASSQYAYTQLVKSMSAEQLKGLLAKLPLVVNSNLISPEALIARYGQAVLEPSATAESASASADSKKNLSSLVAVLPSSSYQGIVDLDISTYSEPAARVLASVKKIAQQQIINAEITAWAGFDPANPVAPEIGTVRGYALDALSAFKATFATDYQLDPATFGIGIAYEHNPLIEKTIASREFTETSYIRDEVDISKFDYTDLLDAFGADLFLSIQRKDYNKFLNLLYDLSTESVKRKQAEVDEDQTETGVLSAELLESVIGKAGSETTLLGALYLDEQLQTALDQEYVETLASVLKANDLTATSSANMLSAINSFRTISNEDISAFIETDDAKTALGVSILSAFESKIDKSFLTKLMEFDPVESLGDALDFINSDSVLKVLTAALNEVGLSSGELDNVRAMLAVRWDQITTAIWDQVKKLANLPEAVKNLSFSNFITSFETFAEDVKASVVAVLSSSAVQGLLSILKEIAPAAADLALQAGAVAAAPQASTFLLAGAYNLFPEGFGESVLNVLSALIPQSAEAAVGSTEPIAG